MRVAVGGTFSILHKGHKLLLSEACRLATTKLLVGITSDMMARKVRDGPVKPFSERKEAVSAYLDSQGMEGRYSIYQIEDLYGFAIVPTVETIVASRDTKGNVELINKERERKGLR